MLTPYPFFLETEDQRCSSLDSPAQQLQARRGEDNGLSLSPALPQVSSESDTRGEAFPIVQLCIPDTRTHIQ